MEYRITVKIAERGSEESAEEVLAAFLEAHAELGPVVGADLETGALSMTFSMDTNEPDNLGQQAAVVLTGVLNRAAIEATGNVTAEVELVGAGADIEREMQPA